MLVALGDVVQSAAHRNLSLQAAMRSFVLLKNTDSFLPLKSAQLPLRSATLVGPFAVEATNLFGDYSPTPDVLYTTTVEDGLLALVDGDRERLHVSIGCYDGPTCNKYERQELLAAVRKERTLIVAALGSYFVLL